MLAIFLNVIDLKELTCVFWQLLGLLEIFIKRAEERALEKMGTVEGIFETFDKGIHSIVERYRRYFLQQRFLFKFKSACEVSCSS